MQDFVNIFIRFNYELQLSLINADDIGSIESWHMTKLLKNKPSSTSTANKDSHGRLEEFFSRHAPIDPYNILMMSYQLWEKVVTCKGDVIPELNKAFSNTNHFQDQNTPEWQKLWHHMDHTDKEIEHLIDAVCAKVKQHDYRDSAVIMHVFGLLISLQSQGYILPEGLNNAPNILMAGKHYVDWLYQNNAISENKNVLDVSIHDSGGLGMSFAADETSEFRELLDHLVQLTQKKQYESAMAEAPNLTDMMSNDPQLFYKLVGSPNFTQSRFWRVPIFDKIDPSVFLTKFLQLDNVCRGYVLDSITERYKWLNSSGENNRWEQRELCKEKHFWVALDALIATQTEGKPAKPSLLWAKRLSLMCISKAIEQLERFEKRFETNGEPFPQEPTDRSATK